MDQFKGEGLDVAGTVCHVSKDSDRKGLIDFVGFNFYRPNYDAIVLFSKQFVRKQILISVFLGYFLNRLSRKKAESTS